MSTCLTAKLTPFLQSVELRLMRVIRGHALSNFEHAITMRVAVCTVKSIPLVEVGH
jgi:hypothetical protein